MPIKKLKVGKKYITRDHRYAVITKICQGLFKYYGHIVAKDHEELDAPQVWMDDGKYFSNPKLQHNNDIICEA